GVNGAHPEIGHHVIDADGPACFCGARGCWEVLARGPAMVQRVLEAAPTSYAHRPALTAERICQLAREGDAIALAEVSREAAHLGTGIANLVTLFAPEVVVLSGSVMQSADLFLPAIREQVRRQCGLIPADAVEIRLSSLAADAPLVGAAMVWGHRFRDTAVAC
ncbi:MAG: ROK family protein, partial [Proteobacteria bacterium]|nr:ROK family protein [Pseudomonadota bacterium]